MIKTKIHSPYIKKGNKEKTFFSDRFSSGVYIVYDKNKIIYIGFSSTDLYKTMYRHFQSWGTSKQYRAIFNRNKHKVRVVYCTAKKAYDLEKALILKHKPEMNEQTYDMYEADNKEIKVLNEYFETDIAPINEYKNEVPF